MPTRKSKRQPEESGNLDIETPEAPTSIDPYAVLSLTQTATQDQIKSAYRKAALKHHPDKAPPDPDQKAAAHAKFQEIAFAYAILSDERRRRRYDVTGRTEESLSLEGEDGEEGEFDWASYYREQYADIITAETINNFAEEYRGSAEEREAVLSAYQKAKGAMGKVYELIMLSDPAEDEERFRTIIYKAIEVGSVEGFDRFTEESEKSIKRRVAAAKKRKEQDAVEADEVAEKLGLKAKLGGKKSKGYDDEGGLAALIQQRQKGRAEGFLADLEAKYAGNGAKKGAKRGLAEPSEEDFAQNRKKGRKGKV